MGNIGSCCCSNRSDVSAKDNAACCSSPSLSICKECGRTDTVSTASHSTSRVSGGPLSSSLESRGELIAPPISVVNPLSSSQRAANELVPSAIGSGSEGRPTARASDELREEGSEEYFASLDDDGQLAHLRLSTALGDALFAAPPDDAVSSSASSGAHSEHESPVINEASSAPLSRWSHSGSITRGSRPESSQGVHSCSKADVGIEFGSNFFEDD